MFEVSICDWFIEPHKLNTDNVIYMYYICSLGVYLVIGMDFLWFCFRFSRNSLCTQREMEWWSLSCDIITWHPATLLNNVQWGTFSLTQIMWLFCNRKKLHLFLFIRLIESPCCRSEVILKCLFKIFQMLQESLLFCIFSSGIMLVYSIYQNSVSHNDCLEVN